MTASASNRWSTWSCTPAICRAPAPSTPRLCGWRPERIAAGPGSYLALELGERVRRRRSSSARRGARCGCPTSRSPRSPRSPSGRAGSGASVLLEPREGPAGWRSVVAAPAGRRGRLLAAEGLSSGSRRTGRGTRTGCDAEPRPAPARRACGRRGPAGTSCPCAVEDDATSRTPSSSPSALGGGDEHRLAREAARPRTRRPSVRSTTSALTIRSIQPLPSPTPQA